MVRDELGVPATREGTGSEIPLFAGADFSCIGNMGDCVELLKTGRSLIFNHVSFKDLAEFLPLLPIKSTVSVQTFGGRVCHVESMMGIVMGE